MLLFSVVFGVHVWLLCEAGELHCVQIGLKADVKIYGDRTEVEARYAKTEQYLPPSLSSL